MNFSIITTLDDIAELFEKNANIQDLISFFRSTDAEITVSIYNKYDIYNMNDLKKWENPKTKVSYVDKTKIKYTTKNGRPIYGRIRKYPSALTGRQIVGALKAFPKNVNFVFLDKGDAIL